MLSLTGTIGYVAPEYMLHLTLTDKCDVYSFGMVLLQMVCTKDHQMVINKANMLADQYLRENKNKYLDGFISIYWLNVIVAFVNLFLVEGIIDPILNGKIAP